MNEITITDVIDYLAGNLDESRHAEVQRMRETDTGVQTLFAKFQGSVRAVIEANSEAMSIINSVPTAAAKVRLHNKSRKVGEDQKGPLRLGGWAFEAYPDYSVAMEDSNQGEHHILCFTRALPDGAAKLKVFAELIEKGKLRFSARLEEGSVLSFLSVGIALGESEECESMKALRAGEIEVLCELDANENSSYWARLEWLDENAGNALKERSFELPFELKS